MSYDMDIWNGEKDYFSDNLEISLLNSEFVPIQKFLNRDPQVIEIVENFLLQFMTKNQEL